MADELTLQWSLEGEAKEGRRKSGPAVPPSAVAPRLPRITRLMALAIKLEGLVQTGAVRDYADIARLGMVSRARVTQIMNLLNLAPEIQEEILFLDRASASGLAERNLRRLTGIAMWDEQRSLWQQMCKRGTARAPK